MSAYLTRFVAVCLFAIGLSASLALADPIPEGTHHFKLDTPVWGESVEPSIDYRETVNGCEIRVETRDFVMDVYPKGLIDFFFTVQISTCMGSTLTMGDGRGKISGKDGSAKLALGLWMSADIMGTPVKGNIKCKQEIDPNGGISGSCKVKICARGVGCAKGEQAVHDQLDPNDAAVEGTLTVTGTDQKRFGGNLTLDPLDVGGMTLDYTVKGGYKDKKDSSKLAMKPMSNRSKGTKIQLKNLEYDPGTGELCGDINSKLVGQSAKGRFCWPL